MLLGAGSGKGEKHTGTHTKGPTARQRLTFKRPSDLFLLFGEVDGEEKITDERGGEAIWIKRSPNPRHHLRKSLKGGRMEL